MLSQTATPRSPGQVTGPPYITLVDLDGFPVGPGEKNIPDVRPEPQPADSWPLWTDLVVCKLGRRDFDLDEIGPVMMADAFKVVMRDADACACDGDHDEDLGGPTEPPDDWEGNAAAGWALAPIAGGGLDDGPYEPYDPTPEDEADYAAWSADLERRRNAEELLAEAREWYARNPISSFNAIRPD